MTRAGVAWRRSAARCGAYEHALAYAKQREQFGRPIAGFQLVQDLLVRDARQHHRVVPCLCARLSQLQDDGRATDAHAALAKAFCTVRMRETVGWARELIGGNGILLDHERRPVLRRRRGDLLLRGHPRDEHADRRQAITGISAFV